MPRRNIDLQLPNPALMVVRLKKKGAQAMILKQSNVFEVWVSGTSRCEVKLHEL